MSISKSIIIEGPNGSGKSYLAKQLADRYKLPLIHSTRPDDPCDAIDKAFRQYHLAESGVYVFDRNHAISRLVYQKNTAGTLEEIILQAIMQQLPLSSTVIYCTGQGERDTNKPHYTPELIKETTDNQKEIKKRKN